MYFIRNGKFSVTVKTDYISPETEDNQPELVSYLIDGDMFGEISLLYNCKRTATVRSENYGNLALLKQSDFIGAAQAKVQSPNRNSSHTNEADNWTKTKN